MTETLQPNVIPDQTADDSVRDTASVQDPALTESVLGMVEDIARAVVQEIAVSMFQAIVAEVNNEGKVNLKRLHNADDADDDGNYNIPADDMYSVRIDPGQSLGQGDLVWCFYFQGNAFVWGKVTGTGTRTVSELANDVSQNYRKKSDKINAGDIGGPGKVDKAFLPDVGNLNGNYPASDLNFGSGNDETPIPASRVGSGYAYGKLDGTPKLGEFVKKSELKPSAFKKGN